jgi:hypothetical protein
VPFKKKKKEKKEEGEKKKKKKKKKEEEEEKKKEEEEEEKKKKKKIEIECYKLRTFHSFRKIFYSVWRLLKAPTFLPSAFFFPQNDV